MEANKIFERLWSDYSSQNPSVKEIYNLFLSEGEEILNDHIAFRTFNHPSLNIDVIAKPFMDAGYMPKGEYIFKSKHLFARHYEKDDDAKAPRVFISELILEDFSDFLQETISKIIHQVDNTQFSRENILFAGNIFGKPSFEIYKQLKEESEYAAWLYVHGFRANHFTVSINGLKNYNRIEKVNQLLKDHGFRLNTSGGEIKGTAEELLQQSSTLADIVDIMFMEGVFSVPACYYEFAQRFPDKNGQVYSGFIAKSADKIFESTDFRDL
jgi:2-oxoadipate dioxygenase/decarboxylase-like protein